MLTRHEPSWSGERVPSHPFENGILDLTFVMVRGDWFPDDPAEAARVSRCFWTAHVAPSAH